MNHRRKRHQARRLTMETFEARQLLTANVDLAPLNDEFEISSSHLSWKRVNETEGWNVDQLEVYDIDNTQPGRMVMRPQTVTWYNNYRGPMAFKEIEGDFVVTSEVHITDRDDVGDSDTDDVPDGATYSLGGIMIRAPRDVEQGAADWQPGGENYVFLSLGRGEADGFQFEVKTTINSNSTRILSPAPANNATLQIARIGDTVITLIKEPGQDWRVHQRYSRPDLPDTLQVGMVAYSDWDNANNVTPPVHNGSALGSIQADLVAGYEYARFARPIGISVGIPTSALTDAQLLSFLGDTPSQPAQTCNYDQTLVDCSGDFVTEIAALHSQLPGRDSGAYVPPTPAQRASFANLAESLPYGSINALAQTASDLGYHIVEYTDTTTGNAYRGLVEDRDDATLGNRGWGTYFIDGSYSYDALIEVTHPRFDLQTSDIGARTFQQSGARGFLMAGTHRYSNGENDSAANHADMAHVTDSIFQTVHNKWNERPWWSAPVTTSVWQVHGFNIDNSAHDDFDDNGAEAVISNGKGDVTPEMISLDDALGEHVVIRSENGILQPAIGFFPNPFDAFAYNTLDVLDADNIDINSGRGFAGPNDAWLGRSVVRNGQNFASLGATTNVQGQSTPGPFIHAEFESNVRDSLSERVEIAEALSLAIVESHDDPATVYFGAVDQTASEDGDPGSITVFRTGATDTSLDVSYSISGTATPGQDYTQLSGIAAIPAGSQSVVIEVLPTNDLLEEQAETVRIVLQESADYQLPGTGQWVTKAFRLRQVTIADNDSQQVVLQREDFVNDPNGSVRIFNDAPAADDCILGSAYDEDDLAWDVDIGMVSVVGEATLGSSSEVVGARGDATLELFNPATEARVCWQRDNALLDADDNPLFRLAGNYVIEQSTSDLDGNGFVSLTDFLMFAESYGKSVDEATHPQADFNGDGFVSITDFLVFAKNYGKEPGLLGEFVGNDLVNATGEIVISADAWLEDASDARKMTLVALASGLCGSNLESTGVTAFQLTIDESAPSLD